MNTNLSRYFGLIAFVAVISIARPAHAVVLQMNLPDNIISSHVRYADAYFGGIGGPIDVTGDQTGEMGYIYLWPFDPDFTTSGILLLQVTATAYDTAGCTGSVVWTESTTSPQVANSNPLATSTFPSVAADFTTAHKSFAGVASICLGPFISTFSHASRQAHWLDSPITGSRVPANVVTDANGGYNPFDYTTRIDAVVPDHIIVATSTEIGLLADIVTNPADWADTWFVRFKYLRRSSSAAAIADINTLFIVIDKPIPYDGPDLIQATTTFALQGNYDYRVEIRKPSILSSITAFFGLSGVYDPGLLAHFDTVFTVDHQTAYDILVGSTTNEIYTLDASTTINFRESCGSIQNFDVVTCLGLLFIPTAADLIRDVTNIKSQILFKAPWGYFSRFLAIVSDTSTSTIPMIDANVPISATESVRVTYDMGDIITGAGAILNSAKTPEGMDVQDIAEPWLRLFLALTVITIIIRDLLKMGNHKQPHGQ